MQYPLLPNVCLRHLQFQQMWPVRHCYSRRRPSCRAAHEQQQLNNQPVCLAQASSQYNHNIAVWSMPDRPDLPPQIRNSIFLTLDASGNIHSMYRPSQPLTGAYWDALALLPALVPAGPVAILGLGAGTIAQLLHKLYPGCKMHGWELDPAVVMVAQQHMGLQQLQDNGCLEVHVGDALSDAAAVDGGATGIIVDLFAEGRLIPQLTEVPVWKSIRQRLAPKGRVMCNLGAAPVQGVPLAETLPTQAALAAMAEAFEGELVCSSLTINDTCNMMAISGPAPTAEEWSRVPAELQPFARGGRFLGWQTHAAYVESKNTAFFDW